MIPESANCAEIPRGVNISKNGDEIVLTWEEVKGAELYYVHKGFFPYSEMNKIDSTTSNYYNDIESSDKCFYEVTASDRFTVNMIYVEGGSFIMGDRYKEGYYDEQPLHSVTLNSFYIQDTEVTQKDWIEVMGSDNIVVQNWGSWGIGDNYPAYGVSWYDAIVYCNRRSIRDGLDACYSINGQTDPDQWGTIPTTQNSMWDAVICDWNSNGYRLLTEAEWEFAARGGIYESDNFRFSGCMEEIDLSKYSVYGSAVFRDVKSKLPNQIGVYGMSGNTIDFCWDWFSYFDGNKKINPIGKKQVAQRMRRGGSRYSTPKGVRITNRATYNPSTRYPGAIGFRIGSSETKQEYYAVSICFPDSTTVLKRGEKATIEWTDNFDENVCIELYYDGVYNSTIALSTTSDGNYDWNVPLDLDTLKSYQICVSSVLNLQISDKSDEHFNVSDDIPVFISINSPYISSSWMKERVQTIRYVDNISDSVKIELYKSGVFSRIITDKIPSNSLFEWLIPQDLTIAEDYQLKITSQVNDSIYCFSSIFNIIDLHTYDMVYIEGGMFSMGDVACVGHYSEAPVHSVTLADYYIGRYEVSQKEYYEIMGSNPSLQQYGIAEALPVFNVHWYATLVYCNKRSVAEGLTPCYSINGSTDTNDWGTVPSSSNSAWNAVICDWNANGYRLPTEAEWEFAARGGVLNNDDYLYSGCVTDDDLLNKGWFSGNDLTGTVKEAGSLLSNQLGLHDMSGNVWEWCWDWYSSYSSAQQTDPTGPSTGAYRIQRGGSWNNYSDCSRSSYRDYMSMSASGYIQYSGFRVVRR